MGHSFVVGELYFGVKYAEPARRYPLMSRLCTSARTSRMKTPRILGTSSSLTRTLKVVNPGGHRRRSAGVVPHRTRAGRHARRSTVTQ
jgi:hypothetical protein